MIAGTKNPIQVKQARQCAPLVADGAKIRIRLQSTPSFVFTQVTAGNTAIALVPRVLVPGVLLLAMTSCAIHPVDRVSSSPIVAVLINRSWTEQDPQGFAWEVHRDERVEEEQFAACVSQAASATDLPLQVITGTRFRALIFPDLEPKSAPRRIQTLRPLFSDPRFQSRVDAAGIRYLAVVGGETQTSAAKGWIGCGGGYGAGGCFGYVWWDHKSQLTALIIDLRSGSEQPREGLVADGKSWFSILGVFPVAAPSGHEARGCARFGTAVAETIGAMHHRGN